MRIIPDENLPRLHYQQDLAGRTLSIVELPTNRLPLLQGLFPRIAAAVESAAPGTYIVVSA